MVFILMSLYALAAGAVRSRIPGPCIGVHRTLERAVEQADLVVHRIDLGLDHFRCVSVLDIGMHGLDLGLQLRGFVKVV